MELVFDERYNAYGKIVSLEAALKDDSYGGANSFLYLCKDDRGECVSEGKHNGNKYYWIQGSPIINKGEALVKYISAPYGYPGGRDYGVRRITELRRTKIDDEISRIINQVIEPNLALIKKLSQMKK